MKVTRNDILKFRGAKMNETLEKILTPVKRAAGKVAVNVGLPLLLIAGAANYSFSQSNTHLPPTKLGAGSYELVSEQERDIHISSKVNPYVDYVTEDVKYTLDVLTVKILGSDKTFTLLYPSDGTWNKGDIIDIDYLIHKDRSRKWTDYEIAVKGLRDGPPSKPGNVGFYDALITKVNDVQPANRD